MLADNCRAARLRSIALEVDDAADGALLIGEVSIHEGARALSCCDGSAACIK
jgi:hypothetical protein